MMRSRVWLALIALTAAAIDVSAQQPPSFKYERPIVTSGSGPRRLAVDVTLLAGANPFRVVSRTTNASGEPSVQVAGGLSDLRLFDPAGREIAYILVQPPPSEPEWKTGDILQVAPVETEKEKTSGFEADFGQASTIDRFRIAGLRPPFLKRVRIEGSGDRAHWTLLVSEGTLFDLPAERLRQLELGFEAGSYRYVRVTWDDTRSGRLPLPGAAQARLVATAAEPPAMAAAVTFERRPNEPGSTRFRIRLPAARLPIVALQLEVGGGHLLRRATVEEARMGGGEVLPVTIGEAMLRRVVQDNITASALKIPIEPPAESTVDLIVNDGDNPPLDLKGVTAVFATLPWIYFESDGTDLAARYGNTTLAAPRYDLEATRDRLRIDTVADARWADARARTTEETAGGAPPPLPTTGALLDVSEFKYLRAIPPGDPGLLVVPLDAAALAHSVGPARRFADVRIVDDSGRQIPFLVERPSEPLSLDVAIERSPTIPRSLGPGAGTRSVYRVRLPIDRVSSARLVLTTSARVFERRITVARERAPSTRRRDPWIETLADATWVHADQDKPTPELTLRLGGEIDTNELLLVVEEGDNSPLPIAGARLLLPAYRLRLYRDRGASLRLAYGRSDLTPPRYDLALLAPQLLGVTATEVNPAGEQAGPAASAAAQLSPRIFWGVLLVSVLVLLAMIVRLVRKESGQAAQPSSR
jgi:Protein of unknown function (DUF3999)